MPMGSIWHSGTALLRTNCSLCFRWLKYARKTCLELPLCRNPRHGVSHLYWPFNFLFCVWDLCLLSSLWESCLAGAGDFLLAGAQHTVWQEIPDVIHRSWRLAFSRALYQLVQMADTVQIWTVQYKSWPWAYAAKPLGWGKRGLQRNIAHRVWPGCWCLCVPGTSIFLVDLPGPERGGFAICLGSQMWRWQETVVWAKTRTPSFVEGVLVKPCTQKTGTVLLRFVKTHWLQQAPCLIRIFMWKVNIFMQIKGRLDKCPGKWGKNHVAQELPQANRG